MAKVYEFPVKKRLPKHIEERLYEVANEYLETLYAALMILGEEGTDQMCYEEILDLVSNAYVKGLEKAIDHLGES